MKNKGKKGRKPGFFRRRATKLKERAGETIAPHTVRDALPNKDSVKHALQPAERDRKLEQQMNKDFERLLTNWGIRERELPTVIKSLGVEITALTVIAVGIVILGFVAVVDDHLGWGFIAVVWAAAMGAVILTRVWRRWVLTHQRFVPFTRWLAGHR